MIENFKKLLTESNIAFEEITSEVISVENFLTEKDLDFLWKRIDKATQEDWEIEYNRGVKQFCLQKFGRDDVENLIAEGKFEITMGWSDKNLSIVGTSQQADLTNRINSLVEQADPNLILHGLATIQRMQTGVQLAPHTDQHTDPSISYASIVYINDDYNGGELFFKNLDLEIKPKAGTLLLFPGDAKHEHGVRAVSDGPIRYVLVGFIKEKGFYQRNRF